MGEALFRRKQLVRHIKTGGVYRIVHAPDTCRLEAGNDPAYAYRLVYLRDDVLIPLDVRNAPIWVRAQSEMEDGRFEPVTLAQFMESETTFRDPQAPL